MISAPSATRLRVKHIATITTDQALEPKIIFRSTLAHWRGEVSFHLAPMLDHMIGELKASNKLFADETRCPLLDPIGGKTETG